MLGQVVYFVRAISTGFTPIDLDDRKDRFHADEETVSLDQETAKAVNI